MSPIRTSARTRIHKAAIHLFAATGSAEVNVSELALAAGVARGTIYNNVDAPERLYDEVVATMVAEMHADVAARMDGLSDPAARLAFGMRAFIQRAHLEPEWGRFMLRFALNDTSLRMMINAPPAVDMAKGVKTGRFTLAPRQQSSALGLVGAAVISAIALVIDGQKGWREASADLTEMVLRALGVPSEEAKKLAAAA